LACQETCAARCWWDKIPSRQYDYKQLPWEIKYPDSRMKKTNALAFAYEREQTSIAEMLASLE
jgi:hypothetical protein